MMKIRFLTMLTVVLWLFCLSSCTKEVGSEGESADVLFSIRVESGWSDSKHILLYSNGLFQVYSGDDNLERCIKRTTDCLIFSEKLSPQTFEDIVEIWDHLPSCRPDSLISFDGPMATFQKDGNEYSFYLSSQVNSELASFVISLMEIYRIGDGLVAH